MKHWLYALVSVAVPALIGSCMYLVFNLLDRRRRGSRLNGDGLPPVDYLI